MPSSVLAEKKTASLCPQSGQRTSLVRGNVGSDRTSCICVNMCVNVRFCACVVGIRGSVGWKDENDLEKINLPARQYSFLWNYGALRCDRHMCHLLHPPDSYMICTYERKVFLL